MSGKISLSLRLDFNNSEDWNLLTQPSAFLNFYNTYGPNGTNEVSLRISLYSNEPCIDYCSEWDPYCQCLYLGQELNGSVGDWSTLIPQNTIVGISGTNQVDSTIIWGESMQISIATTDFIAVFPDFRVFVMPFPPTLASMQNLFALRDTLNGQNNGKLIYAKVDTTVHCPVDETRSGKFWLSNNGYDTITSALIGLGWNGVLQDTIEWTGMIPPYEHRTIYDFGGKTVLLDSLSGSIDIVVLEINGQPDEEPSNNAWYSPSAQPTSINQTELLFQWNTSNFTDHNYFEIVAEDGAKLFQLGYPQVIDLIEPLLGDTLDNYAYYQFPIDITGYDHQCLTFNAYSLTGSYFGQNIRLSAGDQEIINFSGIAGSDHLELRKFFFGMPEATVPTKEVIQATLQIKPNPAQQQVVLQAGQLQKGEVTFAVYSLLGQQVWRNTTEVIGTSASQTIDLSKWPTGLYFVTISNIENGQGIVASRLLVQH